MQGMGLETVPRELQTFVERVVDDIRNHFSDQLVSVILHGSLAMGSFYVPKSDIDLLVIVNGLSEPQSRIFYDLLERHHAGRPYAGGLEVNVIRSQDAKFPKHPMPFLVHFSETTTGPQEYRNGNPPNGRGPYRTPDSCQA